MPPAPDVASVPAAGKPGSGGKGLAGYLKTREGKIVAGGGAVVLVLVMALRKGAGQPAAGGMSADELQGAFVDGTLQDRLDQFSTAGGSVDELIGNASELAGSIDKLTDLLESQNPLPSTPSTPSTPSGAAALMKTLTQQHKDLAAGLQSLNAQRTQALRARNTGRVKQLNVSIANGQKLIRVVEDRIRTLQQAGVT
jgi:hypothetical protein